MAGDERMHEIWDFAVIGGGASGMAAAITASGLHDHVLLLEKSSSLGKKISASGNGRCNLLNLSKLVYYGDERFAGNVMKQFGQERQLQFWQNLGLRLSEDAEGRLYPCTFQASSVLDALKSRLKKNHVDIFLQKKVISIKKRNHLFCIKTNEEEYTSRRVLIASGGAAAPKLGGTTSGYELLADFGHHIVPVFPALCPLVTDSRSISGLNGIRVRCIISVFDRNHMMLQKERGEVLFTDYGISGICAMQCARFIKENGCIAELDFVSRIFPDISDLIAYLKNRRHDISFLQPEQIMSGFLLPRLSFAVMKQAGINMHNRLAGDLTDDELSAVADRLYCYTLQITGAKGLEDAQVTAGGADCSEFDPRTMESRIESGLHAAGELLNVDGDCGGFNLMFAFSSGILAGLNGREEVNL